MKAVRPSYAPATAPLPPPPGHGAGLPAATRGSLLATPPLQPAPARPESAPAVLGRNLVAARLIAGVTQHDLAAASGVSRATIAQLETGVSDPRLSTVVELAAALGVSPLVLLAGSVEVRALAALPSDLAARPVGVPQHEVARMDVLVRSGLIKDRNRAARAGAAVARSAGGPSPAAALTAGLFSATLPGAGTAVGTALGRLIGEVLGGKVVDPKGWVDGGGRVGPVGRERC